MFSTLRHKLISLFQLAIVLLYIVFEELIWEGIAHPIYRYVHALKILETLEKKLQTVNAYVILILFIMMLASVEGFGLYAGYLVVSGNIVLGLSLYLMKIPVAALTFWMFRVTEKRLMHFHWFQWIYERVMALIEWLKSLEIYATTMRKFHQLKKRLKVFFKKIKRDYFAQESPFFIKIKMLYRSIKQILKREK